MIDFQILKWWIDRGYALIPCKPNSKQIMFGWGEHQKRVSSIDQARRVFAGNANVATLGGPNVITLDFDNIGVYTMWCGHHPDYARSYTERTPRGGAHVFLRGQSPSGIVLIDGVEIKRVCMVFPSRVDDKQYSRGEGEILEADPVRVFSHLAKIGTRSAYVLREDQRHPLPRFSQSGHASLIEQIKTHWSVERVFLTYKPDTKLSQHGKVLTGRCPFHDDKNPSFYILPDIGVWGCHACGIRGDVINLYARFENITNNEAISRMKMRLEVAQ